MVKPRTEARGFCSFIVRCSKTLENLKVQPRPEQAVGWVLTAVAFPGTLAMPYPARVRCSTDVNGSTELAVESGKGR